MNDTTKPAAALHCALRGGQCACPTACQLEMAEMMPRAVFITNGTTAPKASAVPEYEATFREGVTALVMRHIDRMNDICDQDPAERIIASFIKGFDPLRDAYWAEKFPGRDIAAAPQAEEAPALPTHQSMSDERIVEFFNLVQGRWSQFGGPLNAVLKFARYIEREALEKAE